MDDRMKNRWKEGRRNNKWKMVDSNKKLRRKGYRKERQKKLNRPGNSKLGMMEGSEPTRRHPARLSPRGSPRVHDHLARQGRRAGRYLLACSTSEWRYNLQGRRRMTVGSWLHLTWNWGTWTIFFARFGVVGRTCYLSRYFITQFSLISMI